MSNTSRAYPSARERFDQARRELLAELGDRLAAELATDLHERTGFFAATLTVVVFGGGTELILKEAVSPDGEVLDGSGLERGSPGALSEITAAGFDEGNASSAQEFCEVAGDGTYELPVADLNDVAGDPTMPTCVNCRQTVIRISGTHVHLDKTDYIGSDGLEEAARCGEAYSPVYDNDGVALVAEPASAATAPVESNDGTLRRDLGPLDPVDFDNVAYLPSWDDGSFASPDGRLVATLDRRDGEWVATVTLDGVTAPTVSGEDSEDVVQTLGQVALAMTYPTLAPMVTPSLNWRQPLPADLAVAAATLVVAGWQVETDGDRQVWASPQEGTGDDVSFLNLGGAQVWTAGDGPQPVDPLGADPTEWATSLMAVTDGLWERTTGTCVNCGVPVAEIDGEWVHADRYDGDVDEAVRCEDENDLVMRDDTSEALTADPGDRDNADEPDRAEFFANLESGLLNALVDATDANPDPTVRRGGIEPGLFYVLTGDDRFGPYPSVALLAADLGLTELPEPDAARVVVYDPSRSREFVADVDTADLPLPADAIDDLADPDAWAAEQPYVGSGYVAAGGRVEGTIEHDGQTGTFVGSVTVDGVAYGPVIGPDVARVGTLLRTELLERWAWHQIDHASDSWQASEIYVPDTLKPGRCPRCNADMSEYAPGEVLCAVCQDEDDANGAAGGPLPCGCEVAYWTEFGTHEAGCDQRGIKAAGARRRAIRAFVALTGVSKRKATTVIDEERFDLIADLVPIGTARELWWVYATDALAGPALTAWAVGRLLPNADVERAEVFDGAWSVTVTTTDGVRHVLGGGPDWVPDSGTDPHTIATTVRDLILGTEGGTDGN